MSINIIEIARGIVGIVEWLGNGATVGGDAEEGLAMFVSPRFGEGGGKLKLHEIMMILWGAWIPKIRFSEMKMRYETIIFETV